MRSFLAIIEDICLTARARDEDCGSHRVVSIRRSTGPASLKASLTDRGNNFREEKRRKVQVRSRRNFVRK